MAKRRNGKAKPRACKPSRGASRDQGVLTVFDGLCREVLDTQGCDVLDGGDAIQAEMWASHLLGMFGNLPLVGEPDPVAAIGGRLVSVARRSRTPQAQVCLRGLAAVAGGPLGRRAGTAARELAASRAPVAGWIDTIGTAEPTAAWRATDLCGNQDSIMIGFAYLDGEEHSIVVLIDHLLGGIAKDAAVLGPLVDLVREWQHVSDIELVEEPVDVAAARVIEAANWTSRTVDAPVTEDYVDTEAMLRARLSPLAGTFADVEPLSVEQREALVRAFLAEPAGAVYAHDPSAWFLVDCLVDFRCDYHGRDPLRWDNDVVVLFLLDWVPRKVTAGDETLMRLPEVLRAWVPWAAHRAGLPADLATEATETIGEIEAAFVEAIADQSNWGPAKALAMRMLAAGVDPGDADAANAWLAAEVPALTG